MNKKLFPLLILAILLAGVIRYSVSLIDWIQTYATETDPDQLVRTIASAVALLAYLYFGIRFFNRHVNSSE